MPIPDFQQCMLPPLKFLGDGQEHSVTEVVDQIASIFSLTAEQRATRTRSGNSTVIRNRVGWARTYLRKSGLVDLPSRGVWKITPVGLAVLAEDPEAITAKFLGRFPGFIEFRTSSRKRESAPTPDTSSLSPEEAMVSAWGELNAGIEDELLEVIKAGTPAFFERLVIDLLVKMGYGGNREDAGQALGKSGDGGIDGVIKEDQLGLDAIYIQAKKWEATVGRPEIQKFAGALQAHKARKGVFLTTGSYSQGALEYAKIIETSIVLIDGQQLTHLMLEHGLGVTTVQIYEIKQVDRDYFDES